MELRRTCQNCMKAMTRIPTTIQTMATNLTGLRATGFSRSRETVHRMSRRPKFLWFAGKNATIYIESTFREFV